jgi:signal transduction histidine kinase
MLQIRSLGEQERLATLGELSAGLAHEIRNPLGAIQGAVELLPQSPWAKVIRDEVQRLEGLVRQFLQMSRKPESTLERMDLVSWLDAVRSRVPADVLVKKGGIHSAMVLADPEALLQVIENWIRNSQQAGAKSIEFGLDSSAASGEFGIFVQDDGEGISPEVQQKIFAPFFTTRREGTGLGLSICRQIAKNHGARIHVTSQGKGTGARFTLWLKEVA